MPRPRCEGCTTPQDSTRVGASSRACAYPTIVSASSTTTQASAARSKSERLHAAAEEVLAEDDLATVVELVGDEHVGHGAELIRGRRPEPVSAWQVHVGERSERDGLSPETVLSVA